MRSAISFILDGKIERIEFSSASHATPTTTVLNYLRSLPDHKSVKEGCAEGDCGACTLVVGERGGDGNMRYSSVDSCLMFLPMLDGKQLVTTENLRGEDGTLHPVQSAMVESGGSQCGYCTPGIIMSLFSLYKNHNRPERREIDDALTGNLCRCTGYQPIVEAAATACVHHGVDDFSVRESATLRLMEALPHDSLRIETGRHRYFRPRSLAEAVSIKHQYPDAIVSCGSTDVALRVTKRHELLSEILDLSAIDSIKHIEETADALTIGSGASLTALLGQTRNSLPALATMLEVFGSQQIRNLATLGGNIGTASPIGDTLPVLLAYGARVALESLNGHREVELDGYFTGYRKTMRQPGELITAVIIPKPTDRAKVKSYKISKRKDLDISTVSAGFRLEERDGLVHNIVLAYGGMADHVKRATATEQAILGRPWHRTTVEHASRLIEEDFTPISDARAGAEMRRIAAKNLLLKFWFETSIAT